MVSAAAQQAFSDCNAFCRDTFLSPVIQAMYRVGTLFREPTFCDATYKFGGFTSPHRYFIISANAMCIDEHSEHPEWGLCIWEPGRIFKVIGTHQKAGWTQITLLEVPEDLRQEFATQDLSNLEQDFVDGANQKFEEALELPTLPEHANALWLNRLELPLGVDDYGHFFESWSFGS